MCATRVPMASIDVTRIFLTTGNFEREVRDGKPK